MPGWTWAEMNMIRPPESHDNLSKDDIVTSPPLGESFFSPGYQAEIWCHIKIERKTFHIWRVILKLSSVPFSMYRSPPSSFPTAEHLVKCEYVPVTSTYWFLQLTLLEEHLWSTVAMLSTLSIRAPSRSAMPALQTPVFWHREYQYLWERETQHFEFTSNSLDGRNGLGWFRCW